MKGKTLVTVGLLVFVGVSLVFAATREAQQRKPVEPAAASASAAPAEASPAGTSAAEVAQPETPGKVLAYYFRGNARCPSCIKIENYTRQAVEKGYAEALADGRLEWHVVNVDEPGNRHFITDYQLYTKSVVLVEKRGDQDLRWKNLDKVWDLLGDETGFKRYVDDEVRGFLEGEPVEEAA